MISRRSFLAALPVALVAAVPLSAHALRSGGVGAGEHGGCTHAHPHHLGKGRLNHPEPREGITAARVIPAAQLRDEGMPEEVVELYVGIGALPEIADGIACYCGCMLPPMSRRSLLTCYHDDGMARGCVICQGTARLVIRRHAEGQTLDRIRAAVDARYAM